MVNMEQFSQSHPLTILHHSGYYTLALLISFMMMLAIDVGHNNHHSAHIAHQLKVNLFALEKAATASANNLTKRKKQQHTESFVSNDAATHNLTSQSHQTKALSAQQHHITSPSSSDMGQDNAKVIHKANYKKQTTPHYPTQAINLGWEGTVILHVKLLKDGAIKRLIVAQSSGYKLLDKAAIKAVQQWEFYPTIINGQAHDSLVKVPVQFIINQS